jgi:hypothetical protein
MYEATRQMSEKTGISYYLIEKMINNNEVREIFSKRKGETP